MSHSLGGACGRAQARASVLGFTLLETLVTLVLVSIVAALMSQGLFQVARIEVLLQGQQLVGQMETLRRIWVQQCLEGLMPGLQETPDRFRGDQRQLSGISSLVPLADSVGPTRLRMFIHFNDQNGRSEVRLAVGADGVESVVLIDWAGQRGAWRYMDAAGEWQPQWPPAMGVQTQALPRLIALDPGAGGGWLVVARPSASAQPLGGRIDLEKLP
ncbi:prepilin-type N-terminal cleavage/methylation domain-containing protein [Paucibacter sp. PLA-PC-4]|uniref:prepilin-type N-terminal cleavage/methylation domain-containing protein n=1 Tax=Paucibacter sp. PLA-PC-4 TaxID=2993655 RepID=UPI00224AD273|nr:prepilin-type N-terminal cleavage/methylation domain-containing protein [Paucibacter sp. PLA-PC-4]MCX2865116.1 prepilin-type N-terminal cleavage/methylation domain-containing protein [Paucibacter sp. PLA-PC-4]